MRQLKKKNLRKIKYQFIFKASYDKANRSSINSYRGPGLLKGWRFSGKKGLKYFNYY